MVQKGTRREHIVSVDVENIAEIVRITKRQQLVMECMGGLFPQQDDLSSRCCILDIACGPGVWALETAFTYPQMEVVGIDPNRTSILYARAQAQTQCLQNVDFQVMDALHGLDFPDATFDVINMQFVDTSIPVTAWSAFLRNAQRVLRPGGSINITTTVLVVTNSKAYEELLRLKALALYKAGYSVADNGYYSGIAAMLSQTLHYVGYQQVRHRAYAIDFFRGTKASEENYPNFLVWIQLVKPFLLRMEVVTEDRFETLYREATIDLLSDNYCGMWHFLTLWGSLPSGSTQPE